MAEDQVSVPEQSAQPSEEQKGWAMACHLAAFAGLVFPFGNIIGPLIVWLVKKDQMPLVNDQGKQSLNFQISLSIVGIAVAVIGGILHFVPIIGWIVAGLVYLAALAVGIYALVLVIMASTKAKEGVSFRYPISLKIIS